MKRRTVVSALILVAGLSVSTFSHAADQPEPPLPEKWSPENKDRIADAYQVWMKGAEYFEILKDEKNDEDLQLVEFSGYTASTRSTLLDMPLEQAVNFGFCRAVSSREFMLKLALEGSDPEIRLQALVVLLFRHSPSSVKMQYQTLKELQKLDRGPRWKTLLEKLEAEFAPARLEAQLTQLRTDFVPQNRGEKERYSGIPTHSAWALQAIGVTQRAEFLPALRELSCEIHRYTNLNAENVLEQFSGPDADAALAECVKSWRSEGAVWAARALKKRNPALYKETLTHLGPPGEMLGDYALLLGDLEDARCVPILCELLKNPKTARAAMFEVIQKLARQEDLPLIQELPEKVRKEDYEQAQKTLKKVLQRFQ